MDTTQLKVGKRYLLPIGKNQHVPVIYNGFERWAGYGGETGARQYAFTRMDTGEQVFLPAVKTMGVHYDGCVPPECTCKARLLAEPWQAPAPPLPTAVTD
jgi:hypothetical protein